ncbi:NUDIX domain-containing protein [Glycomyces salinus]|uniref:NUDIX domain-containing protein n=1 Tax=Glycomyces salinus TaxID=980294 RepID=UPI001E2B2972|nr:NUDIX domain-containing protein [Glycomyces salinus]
MLKNVLEFRQRAASYVLRRAADGEIEVLVMLHLDAPEAGTQIPGGGAHPRETPGEAAIREAVEETGVRGLNFGEVMGNLLFLEPELVQGHQVTTYSWLATRDDRDAWDHVVSSEDGDNGIRMHCEFRPARAAGIDWEMDCFLDRAVERFAATR